MKLLFDENLSPRLVRILQDVYPESEHVHSIGLGSADDAEVWTFARERGFTIVSRDADFAELSLLRGFPPKVVLVRRGNCSTGTVAEILLRNHPLLHRLDQDAHAAILVLE